MINADYRYNLGTNNIYKRYTLCDAKPQWSGLETWGAPYSPDVDKYNVAAELDNNGTLWIWDKTLHPFSSDGVTFFPHTADYETIQGNEGSLATRYAGGQMLLAFLSVWPTEGVEGSVLHCIKTVVDDPATLDTSLMANDPLFAGEPIRAQWLAWSHDGSGVYFFEEYWEYRAIPDDYRKSKTNELKFWNTNTNTVTSLGLFIPYEINGFDVQGLDGKDVLIISSGLDPIYSYSESLQYAPIITSEPRCGIYTYICDEFHKLSNRFEVESVDKTNSTNFREKVKLSVLPKIFPYSADRLFATCYGSISETNSDGTTTSYSGLFYYISSDGKYWTQYQFLDLNHGELTNAEVNFKDGFKLIRVGSYTLVLSHNYVMRCANNITFGGLVPNYNSLDITNYVISHNDEYAEIRQGSYTLNDPERILAGLGYFTDLQYLYMVVEISFDGTGWITFSIEEIESVRPTVDPNHRGVDLSTRNKMANLTDKVTAVDSIQFNNLIQGRDNYRPISTSDGSGLAHTIGLHGEFVTKDYALTLKLETANDTFDGTPQTDWTHNKGIAFSTFKSNVTDGEVMATFQVPKDDQVGMAGLVFRAIDKDNFFFFRMNCSKIYETGSYVVLGFVYQGVEYALATYNDSMNTGIIAANVGGTFSLRVRFEGSRIECYCNQLVPDADYTVGKRISTGATKVLEYITDGDGSPVLGVDITYTPKFHSGYVGIIGYSRLAGDPTPITYPDFTPWNILYDFSEAPSNWTGWDPENGWLSTGGATGRFYYNLPKGASDTLNLSKVMVQTNADQVRIGIGKYATLWQAPVSGTATFIAPSFTQLVGIADSVFWVEASYPGHVAHVNQVYLESGGSVRVFEDTWSHTIDLTATDGGFSIISDAVWDSGDGWAEDGTDFHIKLTLPYYAKVDLVHITKTAGGTSSYTVAVNERKSFPCGSGTDSYYSIRDARHPRYAEFIDIDASGAGTLSGHLTRIKLYGTGANPFDSGTQLGRGIIKVPSDGVATPFTGVTGTAGELILRLYEDHIDLDSTHFYDSGHHYNLSGEYPDGYNGRLDNTWSIPYNPNHSYGWIAQWPETGVPTSSMFYPSRPSDYLFSEIVELDVLQPSQTTSIWKCHQFCMFEIGDMLSIESLVRRYAAYGGIHETTFKSQTEKWDQYTQHLIDGDGFVVAGDGSGIELGVGATPGDQTIYLYGAPMPLNYWFEVETRYGGAIIILNSTSDTNERIEVALSTTSVGVTKWIDGDYSVLESVNIQDKKTWGKTRISSRNIISDSTLNVNEQIISVWCDDRLLTSISIDPQDGRYIGVRCINSGFGDPVYGATYGAIHIPNMLDILEWSSLDPGEAPMTAIRRATEDRYIKMFVDEVDNLHVFKPVDENYVYISDAAVLQVESDIDVHQVFTHLRFRGPFHWVTLVDEDLAKTFNHRFMQVDNTSQYSTEDCIREANLLFKRQREQLQQFTYRTQGFGLGQPEDTILIPKDNYEGYETVIVNDLTRSFNSPNIDTQLSVRKKVT